MSFSREISLGISAREFALWCQPLQDARSGRCCGVEILLRWNNPRRGTISPEVFIPIAEGNNLIIPLTRYVIAETARRPDAFPRDRHFHIAINVAARHFANGLLLRDLHNYWFSVDPVQQLVVELTERDVLQDGDQHMAEHLHFKGVQLAIDDFGTGNTSLSWLEKLRPDVLKIDRSFTSSVGIDSVNATVTDIIIALANRLHIVTVAEGWRRWSRKATCVATASMCCRGFIMRGRCRWRRSRRGWPAGRRVRMRARRQNNSPAAAAGERRYSSSLGGRVTTARTRSTR